METNTLIIAIMATMLVPISDELSPPPFDDTFIKWLNILDIAHYFNKVWKQFTDYYGTHYLVKTVFGAR